MNKIPYAITLILSFSILSFGCGKKETDRKLQQQKEELHTRELDLDADIDGQYLAKLIPLNESLAGKISGAFTFSREDDEIVGDVRLVGGAPHHIYSQYVRIGNRCPGLEDDLNNDGFIDVIEGELVFGKVLIPLDGDLGTQRSHNGVFPITDKYGNYIYSKVASFDQFIQDLRAPDHSADEGMAKLKSNERLNLVGKVVVIHGVPPESVLPFSVASQHRLGRHLTLPVACGVIEKVLSTPGVINEGPYAGIRQVEL
jgi:hypothetical protein